MEGIAETEAAIRCALEDEPTRELGIGVKTALDGLVSEWRSELGMDDQRKVDLPNGSSTCGVAIGFQGRVKLVVAKDGAYFQNAEHLTRQERIDRYSTVEADRNATFGAVIRALHGAPVVTCEARYRDCDSSCSAGPLWCSGQHYVVLRDERRGMLGLPVNRAFAAGYGYMPLKLMISGERIELEYPPHGALPARRHIIRGTAELATRLRAMLDAYPRAVGLAVYLTAPHSTKWSRVASVIDESYCVLYRHNALFVLGEPEPANWQHAMSTAGGFK